MNRKNIFLWAFAAFVGVFSLASCGDDDETESIPKFDESLISGRWQISQIDTVERVVNTVGNFGTYDKAHGSLPLASAYVEFGDGKYTATNQGQTIESGTYTFGVYRFFLSHGLKTDTLDYKKYEGKKLILEKRTSTYMRVRYNLTKQ